MFFICLINILLTYILCSFFRTLSIFYIVLFSIIVLNSEILSLFSAFNVQNVSILSIIEVIIAYAYFVKTKTPAYFPNIKYELTRIKNSLKLDKLLFLVFIFFCFMLFSMLIVSICSPAIEPDSRSYHFVRIFYYIKHQNFHHFDISQTRNIVMPFNSEIIYSYFYLFKRNILTADLGFGLLAYFSFINVIFQIYLILRQLKFSVRKTLFTIFIVCSTGAVLVQISSLQTDIVVASLVLSSVYLLLNYKKNQKNPYLFLSSLSYALAIGTKTTAIIIFPAYLVFLFYVLKNKTYIFKYFSFLFCNFLIFASYNYILNFLDFKDFISPISLKAEHVISNGIKEYIFNFVSIFNDFFGYSRGFVYEILEAGKKFIFTNLHIQNYQILFQNNNQQLYDERVIGFAHLGLLFFISLIISLVYFFRTKNKRYKLIGIFSFVFILNYILICVSLIYFPYTVRFFVTYTLISCFSLIYIYQNKVLKYLAILFACLNLILYSIFLTRLPLLTLTKVGIFNKNLSTLKERLFQKPFSSEQSINEYDMFQYTKKFIKKTDKIAVINDPEFYEIIQMMNFGYDINVINIEEILDLDKIRKYDYIFSNDGSQYFDNYKINTSLSFDNNFNCIVYEKIYKKQKTKVASYCMLKNDLFFRAGFVVIKFYKNDKRKVYLFKRIK